MVLQHWKRKNAVIHKGEHHSKINMWLIGFVSSFYFDFFCLRGWGGMAVVLFCFNNMNEYFISREVHQRATKHVEC